jgi:hypothetical protein
MRDERRVMLFKNWVLKVIFGLKKNELRGEWRKLHKKELTDLYSSPNTTRGIKSRRIKWTGMQHE